MQVGGWAAQRMSECGDQRGAGGGVSVFDRGQCGGGGVGGVVEGGVVESAQVSVAAEPGWGEHRHRSGSGLGWWCGRVVLIVGQVGPSGGDGGGSLCVAVGSR